MTVLVLKRLRVALGVTLVGVIGMCLVSLVGCILLQVTSRIPEIMLPAEGALSASMMAWAVLGLVSLFACFLICWRKRRIDGLRGCRKRWIVLYALFAGAGAAGFAAIAAYLMVVLTGKAVQQTFSSWWESASPMLLHQVQEIGQCCGFGGLDDRVLEPCQRFTPAIGCWPGMLQMEWQGHVRVLVGLSVASSALSLGAALMAVVLLVVRLRTGRSVAGSNGAGGFTQAAMLAGIQPFKPVTGSSSGPSSAREALPPLSARSLEANAFARSEPFDAWHKAVFSN
jgi:hypothetical protein